MKERQFAAYINAKNSAELKKEINTLQKEVDSMQRRSDELSALFKRLYEDNVLAASPMSSSADCHRTTTPSRKLWRVRSPESWSE